MPSYALSFDLDSTLLDNSFIRGNIAACCRFAAERSGIEVSAIANANSVEFAAYWPAVEAGLALGKPTGQEMIREVWRRALSSCGCDDAQVLDDLIAEHLRLDHANARLFADARPVLDELRANEVRLALITNGPSDTQRMRLASLGIEDWFDVVVISGELGEVKPSPAVFAVAAKGLGIDGRDLWHVGDNLDTDVVGAVSAGHTAVWLNRDNGEPAARASIPPHFEIRSLRELQPLLRARS